MFTGRQQRIGFRHAQKFGIAHKLAAGIDEQRRIVHAEEGIQQQEARRARVGTDEEVAAIRSGQQHRSPQRVGHIFRRHFIAVVKLNAARNHKRVGNTSIISHDGFRDELSQQRHELRRIGFVVRKQCFVNVVKDARARRGVIDLRIKRLRLVRGQVHELARVLGRRRGRRRRDGRRGRRRGRVTVGVCVGSSLVGAGVATARFPKRTAR